MNFPKILIVDHGSQYTLLIAKIIRQFNVYSVIVTKDNLLKDMTDFSKHMENVAGIILSGGPNSAPNIDEKEITLYQKLLLIDVPILGICYGAQLLAHLNFIKVEMNDQREYGSTQVKCLFKDEIYQDIKLDENQKHQVWMSHSDGIRCDDLINCDDLLINCDDLMNDLMKNSHKQMEILACTEKFVAIFRLNLLKRKTPIYGFQFHPEVNETAQNEQFFDNFLTICQVPRIWNSQNFLNTIIPKIQKKVGDQQVLVACSGGVDSTITALIIQKAIGSQMRGIFVNNGLLRKNEYSSIMEIYHQMGLNVEGVDQSDLFYQNLRGVVDPEEKRKIIGRTFIDIFKEYSPQVNFLGQGTIYSDVIESYGNIKSHHNVGGLPKELNLTLIEPLRSLFKNEVRELGRELGLSSSVLNRHPFPGPGLAIRILGEITSDKVKMLQEADNIFTQSLLANNYYSDIWQAGVILLDSKSVGVMGDNRTYEHVVALRAVTSVNGMTANVFDLPVNFLINVANQIVNQVAGINRVVYDITSKPPGTIEWE